MNYFMMKHSWVIKLVDYDLICIRNLMMKINSIGCISKEYHFDACEWNRWMPAFNCSCPYPSSYTLYSMIPSSFLHLSRESSHKTSYFYGNSIYDALTTHLFIGHHLLRTGNFFSHFFLPRFFSLLYFSTTNIRDSSKQRYLFLRNYFLSIFFLVCVYCHKDTLILVFFSLLV